MEAETLKKKKAGISKGKVKKSIKNVLCRPDPIFWPELSEEHIKVIETSLEKHKVDVPEFIKPHWKEIKRLSKEERPKPPLIKKVEGLIFGINECKNAILNQTCWAIIVESNVNPRGIIQPLIDTCVSKKVLVLCLKGLRKTTAAYFGIPTSCLGFKLNHLQDVEDKISKVAQSYKPPEILPNNIILDKSEKMEIDEVKVEPVPVTFTYLYRDSKKTRVFNPSLVEKSTNTFIGQDFIKFTENNEQKPEIKKNNAYMTMILKKITNNQNRVKRKN